LIEELFLKSFENCNNEQIEEARQAHVNICINFKKYHQYKAVGQAYRLFKSNLWQTLREANRQTRPNPLQRNRSLATSIEESSLHFNATNATHLPSVPIKLLAKPDLWLISTKNEEIDNDDVVRIAVHRSVCRVQSIYFRRLFDANFGDSNASELTLPCSGEALRVLVLFIYGVYTKVSGESVVDVLAVAHLLQWPAFIDFIESIIIENVDSESIHDLLPISFVYGSERLRTALLLLHKVFCDEEERNNDDEHSVFSEEMKAKLQEVEKSFIACSAAVPSVRPGLLLSVSTLWSPPPLSVCTEQHNARSFRTGQK